MNLSSLGSFTSLATNALGTARSTFKGLADAAIDADSSKSTTENSTAEQKAAEHKAAGQKAAEKKAAEKKAAVTKRAEIQVASKADATADTKAKGGRFGALLDAYA